MIENYDPETKKAIEQVIDVFQDYIQASPHFELLWSDKVGYIYIGIYSVHGLIADMNCWVVDCVKELLDKLISEIAMDTMEEDGHTMIPRKQLCWSAEK